MIGTQESAKTLTPAEGLRTLTLVLPKNQNTFTAHNIELDDGSLTFPAAGVPIGQERVVKAFKRLLDVIFPGDRRQLRLVDLACLEGGYATEFARQGFDTLGIEIRKSNFENCLHVKQHVNLPNLAFANDDVWNLEKYGSFDVIFCSGILYHLDRPKAFVEMMSRCCRKAVIINTHFATDQPSSIHKLGPLTENEGLPGRWYFEHQLVAHEQLERMKWSSWGNSKSFWIKRESLLQVMKDSGFNLVLEQYDGLGDDIAYQMTSGYYKVHDRSTFVGIKC